MLNYQGYAPLTIVKELGRASITKVIAQATTCCQIFTQTSDGSIQRRQALAMKSSLLVDLGWMY